MEKAAKDDDTIIEGGHIRTKLIDTKTLICENLAAYKGTIAGFRIDRNSLKNEDFSSYIQIKNENKTVYIGGDNDGAIYIDGYLDDKAGLSISTKAIGIGEIWRQGTAIKSSGSHFFDTGHSGVWTSPGVLFAGLYTGRGLQIHWKVSNINVSAEWITRDGDSVNRYRITHNLGHTGYVPMLTAYTATAINVQAEQQTYPLVTAITSTYFDFTMKNTDNRAEIPDEPVLISILGCN